MVSTTIFEILILDIFFGLIRKSCTYIDFKSVRSKQVEH